MTGRRWLRRLTVGALAVLTVVSTTAAAGASAPAAGPAPPAGAPAPVGEQIGIGAGSGILWADDASRRADLDAIAATGARWFTLDIDWNSIQPRHPFEFDWTVPDRVVRDARARGLRIIGVLAYSPDWAEPPDCPPSTTHCLPERVADYARFAKAAALRYGAHGFDPALRASIVAWQIWNEANHGPFALPRPDVGRYTAMLRRAAEGIRDVDPASTILAGGTAPAPDDPGGRDIAPVTFLEGIYEHGGGDSFDAFSHHPYSFPCSPLLNRSWNAFFQTYWLHQAMVAHGDGDRLVWGTEVGAPTGPDVGTCGRGNGVSVTEPDQGRIAVDALRAWTQTFGSFTGPLVWFQIRDRGTDPRDWDQHFGLLRHDRSVKPAYLTLTEFLARPSAPRWASRHSSHSGVK